MANRGKLFCDTCGDANHFETKDDNSYVKCTACGREYLGGYNELLELNRACIEKRAKTVGKKIVADKLKDILKKRK